MKKTPQKGIAQIVILGIMGLLAIVLPVATKLVQENQENRSQAAVSNVCSTVKDRGNVKCASGSRNCLCFVYTNADGTVKEAKWVCADCASDKTCNYGTGTCVPNCISYNYSAWSPCSSSGTHTRTVISTNPAVCTGGPARETSGICTPICISYNYSAWSPCSSSGTHTRTVISTNPAVCTGGPAREISGTCTPTCTGYNYSVWSPCSSSGTMTRTVLSTIPAVCTGGPAREISGTCTPTCTGYNYSVWSPCSSSGTMTRTVLSTIPAVCTGGPAREISGTCTPTCTGYNYSVWSPCSSSGTMTRTVLSTIPAVCTGGPAREISGTCTPPVTCSSSNCGNCGTLSTCNVNTGCVWSYNGNYCEVKKPCTGWTFSAWTPATCDSRGIQTRTVTAIPSGCNSGIPANKPSTSQTCTTCSNSNCGNCVTQSDCTKFSECSWGYNGSSQLYCYSKTSAVPVVLKESKCNTFGNLAIGVTNVFAGDDLCVDGFYVKDSLIKTDPTKFTWQCGGSGYTTKPCEVKKASLTQQEKFCNGTCLTTADKCIGIGGTVATLGTTYSRWSNCDDGEKCCINITSGPAKCGFSGNISKELVAGDDLCELGNYSNFKKTSTGWTWTCGPGSFGTYTPVNCSVTKVVGINCANIRDDAFCISAAQCTTGTGTNLGASDCRTGETCCWGIQTKINGVCGTSKFTCKAGTVDDGAVADTSTYYKWICRGVGTGITNSGTCQSSKGTGGNPPPGGETPPPGGETPPPGGETPPPGGETPPPGGETPPPGGETPPPANLTGIILSPNPMNLKVGQKENVHVETIPSGLTATYNWESDDASVASVDMTGKVTGKKPGQAYIIARVDGTGIEENIRVVVEEGSSTTQCTGYQYSLWGECTNGFETQTIIGYLPEGCTGKPSIGPDPLTQSCGDPESDVEISFKFAFAGIAPNAKCISEYLIPETKVKVDINNVPSNKYKDNIQTSFEETNETDSKGNKIFKVTALTLDKGKFGSVNNFNYVKIKGPWHLKRRMCQDGQNSKLPESTVCSINLKKSNTKVYDFSEYTLLSGDVFNDGIINTLDLSYQKTRLDPGATPTCGVEGDTNLDGVVNSFDLNLTKDSLTERDDE